MNCSRSLPVVLALVLACIAPSTASAMYGDLDASFGIGGKVRLAEDMSGRPKALRVQSDGKILLSTAGGLFRLNRDGSRDKSFNVGGKFGSPHDIETLRDGRIVLIADGKSLTVLKPNGKLDTGFADHGTAKLGDGTIGMQGFSIAVQGGTKILVSGTENRSTVTTTLMRFTSDGSVDSTFGSAGRVSVAGAPGGEYPDFGRDNGSAVAVNTAGEILLGIDHVPSGQYDAPSAGVAKFTPDGERVSNFGVGGLAPVFISGDAREGVANIIVSATGNFIALGQGSFWGKAAGTSYFTNYIYANGLPATRDSKGLVSRDAVAVTRTGFFLGSYFKPIHDDFSPDSGFDRRPVESVSLGDCDYWGPIAAYPNGSLVTTSMDEPCYDDERVTTHLTMTRLLGPSGGKPAPFVSISSPVYETYQRGGITAYWLKSVRGVAGPVASLRSVGVAIQRLDSKLLSHGRCRWLTHRGTRSAKTRARNGRCTAPRFMSVTAGAKWKFRFRRPLPVGNYRLYVRAKLKSGATTPFSKDRDSFRSFKVVKTRS